MAQDQDLELHVQTTAHATIISCQFPDGNSFSQTIDGNINALPETERNKIIGEISVAAHTAYVAGQPKENFASLVKKALEKKQKKKPK